MTIYKVAEWKRYKQSLHKMSNIESKSSKRKRKSSSKQTVVDALDDHTTVIPTDTNNVRTALDDTINAETVSTFAVDNDETKQEDTKKKRTRKRQKSKRKDGNNDNEDDDEQHGETKVEATNQLLTEVIPDKTIIITDGSDEIDRTVYMEGIPFHATYEQIVDFLTRTAVSTTTIPETSPDTHPHRTNIHRNEIVDIRLPIWQDTGRYRGYGHVVFTTQEIQQYAIQHLHQQYFFENNNNNNNNKNNRYISMTQAKSKRTSTTSSTAPSNDQDSTNGTPILSEPSKTIILRNLSYQATEEDIFHDLEELSTGNTANSTLSFTTPTLESGQIRVVRHTIPPYRSKGMAYITFPSLNDAMHCIKCIQQQASSSSPFSICQRTITHYDYDHGRIKGSFRTAQHTFWSTTYRSSSNSNNNINNNQEQQQQPRSLKHRMNK